MSGIQRISILPKYTQKDGLAVIDSLRPELPFEAKVLQFVVLPPKAIGGNHKHPRTEAFMALGSGLEFHWQDNDGKTHIEPLVRGEVIVVDAFIPHAVINTSNSLASVAEWADAVQANVEKVAVISAKE